MADLTAYLESESWARFVRNGQVGDNEVFTIDGLKIRFTIKKAYDPETGAVDVTGVSVDE